MSSFLGARVVSDIRNARHLDMNSYSPAATSDLKDVLVGWGLMVDGGASPLDTDGGAGTFGAVVGTTGTFSAASSITHTTAATITPIDVLTLELKSSGTPGAGFGADLEINLESSTTEGRSAGTIRTNWSTATDATRASRMVFFVYSTTSGQTFMTATANSGGVQLGVYGATPVAQHSSTGETTGFTGGASTACRVDSTFTGNVGATAYTLSDVVKALKNFGIMAQ